MVGIREKRRGLAYFSEKMFPSKQQSSSGSSREEDSKPGSRMSTWMKASSHK